MISIDCDDYLDLVIMFVKISRTFSSEKSSFWRKNHDYDLAENAGIV